MKNICKYCKTEHNNFGSHVKECAVYKDLELSLTISGVVKSDYKLGYSIHSLCKKYEVGRHFIERCIINSGDILRGFNYDDNSREFKQKQSRDTLMERYGVINPGQLDNHGYTGLNNISYEKPLFADNLSIYRKKVEMLTQKIVRKLKVTGNLPLHCAITGIEFADNKGKVNPNDFRKRSADHIRSVLYCFIHNISIEEAASINNITFMLRYCNTIKGNMNLQDFKEQYGEKLTALLKHED